ncbi:unnamed protein product [Linum tenue]|uniref:Uncharacterized protein n=1 Tax=Linum tenue TaxID=586396 RepID=A0AAV0H240_9ROSI|nr:unnamed protein product [Linum tenue]
MNCYCLLHFERYQIGAVSDFQLSRLTSFEGLHGCSRSHQSSYH